MHGMTRLAHGLAVATVAVGLASPAAALEPLSTERHINDRLVAARIADRVRRECPSIDGRLVYAFQQARALQQYALDKGYSKQQIEAFLDDKAERRRIYAIADDYMTGKGVRAGDAASFCRLGLQEIADGSVTGSLLVAK